ncbi:MAG: PEGA domain-containing protein [Vicinamibacterales bacterium]
MSLDGTGYSPPLAFGRFRVLHQVGAGALGPVFRGHDPEHGRLVAIKVFRLDLPPEKAAELAVELQRVVDLALLHPGLVTMHAAGLEGSAAYLVQDFLAADSLDAALRNYGPAPALQALNVLTRLAGALDFSAAVGAFHGAFHSRDVLVSPDESRITGIGVAGALERCGISNPGRRPYAAPERLRGAPPGSQSDVYSLAVCAHELLTARRPVPEGDELSLRLESLGWDQERAAAVFRRGFAVNPDDRYPSALEFVTALQETLEEPARFVSVGDPHELVQVEPEGVGRDATGAVEPIEAAVREDAIADRSRGGLLSLEKEHEAVPAGDDIDFFLQADRANGIGTRFPARAEEVDGVVSEAPDTAEVRSGTVSRAIPADGARPMAAPEVTFAARSKLAGLPLLLTLLVGLLVGFVAGYVFGVSRSLPAPAPGKPTLSQAAQLAGASKSDDGEAGRAPEARPPGTTSQAAAADSARSGGDAAITAKAAATAPARPAPGAVLEVRSTPGGARVVLNGEARGKTPLSIGNLPPGRYIVDLALPGYASVRREVALRAGQSERVSLALTRTPQRPAPKPQEFVGSMLVESRPSGARVVLDGQRVGTTPLSLPNVPAGSHVVRLELDGHLPWAASVRVAAGQRATVRGSLEPERSQ